MSVRRDFWEGQYLSCGSPLCAVHSSPEQHTWYIVTASITSEQMHHLVGALRSWP